MEGNTVSAVELRPPSQTAKIAAMCRAVHFIIGEEPKLLKDSYAIKLLGFDSDEALLGYFDSQPVSQLPGLPTLFSLRNRYAEDELDAVVDRGTAQYVILGAGLDSFAYRRRDVMNKIDVFEVDHPASQAWKRERVAELGLSKPDRLKYAPVDFEYQSLTAGLTRAGFDRGAPVFVCLLGVTQYLTQQALSRTLREISGLSSAGCTLVMEFAPPFSLLDRDDEVVLRRTMEAYAKIGEPWLTHLTAAEAETLLRETGFSRVTQFDRAAINDRYLRTRTKDSLMPRFVSYLRADVEQ